MIKNLSGSQKLKMNSKNRETRQIEDFNPVEEALDAQGGMKLSSLVAFDDDWCGTGRLPKFKIPVPVESGPVIFPDGTPVPFLRNF